jgi:hypothetical protein
MTSKRKRLPLFLVGGTIVLGLVIILVSLFASRVQWDRETVVAAANYDGAALIRRLADLPVTSVTFREIDSGPLAADLRTIREAWITWTETFSTESGFSGIIEAYRSRLDPIGWESSDSSDPAIATFRNGEWKLTLTQIPDPKSSASIRFRRLIEWRTFVP